MQSARRKVRRGSHNGRRFGLVLAKRPSPVFWEASLGQRVNRIHRVRKNCRRVRSERAELGADVPVPEGDASEVLCFARDTTFDAETSEAGHVFRERLFQLTRRGGSAGEQERMPASRPIGRSGCG